MLKLKVVCMNMIKLFISVFKSNAEKTGDILLPVSAGASLYSCDDPKLELCDDSGENISEKNQSYCELTVQYWAWKNCDFDFGGLMHQRRYFDFSDTSPFSFDNHRRAKKPYRIFDEPDADTLRKLKTDYKTISSLMQKYRIIAPLSENIYQSVSRYYDRNDRKEFDDLSLLCNVIDDLYPDYSESARQYLGQNYSYFCNMFLMDRELFCSYSQWLFDILFEYDKRKPEKYFYPREQGKLAERLFGVYMTYLKSKTDIPWAELPRAHFASVGGITMKNLSFNKKLYRLCPPGSRRRGILRRLRK